MMLLVLAKRVLLAIPTLLGVTIVIFLLMNVLPGDPSSTFLSPDASPEERRAVRERLGLNDPLPVRYVHWLWDVMQGNLGYSPYRRRDVGDLIAQAWQNTAILAATSATVGLSLGFALGVIGGVYHGRWPDRLVTTFALLGISMPSVWVAILLLIVFSAQLDLLPSSGTGRDEGLGSLVKHLLMPVAAGSLSTIAITARVARASMIETLGADFVDTLRAKGLPFSQVLRHVIKNAAGPILTTAGLQIGYLLGGAVLIETIFRWPGMGTLVFTAITARDLLVVEGAILVIASTFVILNVTFDMLQVFIDPRLRKSRT